MLVFDVWNSSMTTESSAATDELPLSSQLLYKVSQSVWFYVSPVILLFGNFGNVMIIIIMHRMKSNEAVINIYFTALAVIDLVALDIFLLFEWIGITFGYYIEFINDPVCKIHNWIITACTTISGWFLVGLTTHRAVSVVWPHRVHLLCTRRLVTSVVLGMTAFHAAVYSHYLYGFHMTYVSRVDDYRCSITEESYLTFLSEVFTYIDLVLYSLLPFTCIAVANGVLVCKLRTTVREVGHALAEKGSEQAAARQKAASSVTVTVLLVSVAFVVLTLPSSVYVVSLHISSFYAGAVTSNADIALAHLLNAVTYMLMFCNSSVNFYLYCLTGQRFRQEFVKMFCPAPHPGPTSGSADP